MAIFNHIREPLELRSPNRRDQSVLIKVAAPHAIGVLSARRVDHLGPLADEHLPRAKQHGAGLLCFCFYRDEAHGCAQRRLDDRFGIRRIFFLAAKQRSTVELDPTQRGK
ncbi:MAG: hypothetical protein ACOH2H_23260 [Cypionkella sp.]